MAEAKELPVAVQGGPIRGPSADSGMVPWRSVRLRPAEIRGAATAVWKHRESIRRGWRILTRGVCDGCSLGPRGLEDDVTPGLHLCQTRLDTLRDDTAGGFAPADVTDIAALRRLDAGRLRALGRVPYPFLYRRGTRGFERLSWDAALALVAAELSQVVPERQAWLAGGQGISNESYYVFQKAARLLGCNNVDFNVAFDPRPARAGLEATLGCGGSNGALADLVGTDLLVLWGADLAVDHPVALKYLRRAKAVGTRIVAVVAAPVGAAAPSAAAEALFESQIVDDLLVVRPGGQVALAALVAHLLLDWNAVDRSFVEAHTEGIDAFAAALTSRSMEDRLAETGLAFAQVEWLARLLARARTHVTVWSAGDDASAEPLGSALAAWHLVRGTVGREKCGLIVLQHPAGLLGGSDMGVHPEALSPEVGARWGHPLRASPGRSARASIAAGARSELDFLFTLGGGPDPSVRAGWPEACREVRTRIHQDTHLNPGALLEPGAWVLLLPAQGRHEQRGGGITTSAERRIRFSPAWSRREPIGEVRPPWLIPGLVAGAARPELLAAVTFADAADVRREIARLIPTYAGIENMRSAGDWLQVGGERLFRDGNFERMPNGRARFLHPIDRADASVEPS